MNESGPEAATPPGRSMRKTVAAAAASLALLLSGCGASTVAGGEHQGSGAGRPCGTVNLAVNAWVGYEADAAVVSYLARTRLGCTVVAKQTAEQVSWQGLPTGQVDAILENWGHDDLKKQYIETMKVAQDAGPTGNIGQIGWFVPPWMAQQYPDITDWHNLNKYASLFQTSESGGKGQLLDGDPSYVTNDAALVQNLQLNYKVVEGGSETALITSLRQAQQQRTPMLAYFYSPQWFLNEVPLVRIPLPPYTPGCDAVPAKIACDYPTDDLDKIVSTKFAQSGSPAYTLVKNFHWSNTDQNEVAKSIAVDHMSDDDAAKKFIDAHPDMVAQWLTGTGAKP
jgi:glycine betaine/proline transport system substrate-binding protein